MLSVAEARAQLLALVRPTEAETVPLMQACGRVLAGAVTSTRTQPPFAASAMDGYALRRGDLGAGKSLDIIGVSAAGHGFGGAVGPGQAVRIFTGAPVPPGADTVVIQENVARHGYQITLQAPPARQSYIRPAGDDFHAKTPFSATGPLGPTDISLLAAMNHATLSLRRRPVIALIPTGDELVPPGQLPGPDQIVSSNVYGLAALLERLGALPRLLPIARDSEASLLASFDLAQDVDLIVTLGGASVGDHDLVQSAARTHGLDLSFHKVAMRPGKPLMSGRLRGTAMVGLPGNPVSAIACGVVFLQPMVRAFLGLDPALPRRIAALSHALGANGPREHYMRARLTPGTNGDALCVFERQDSALLSVLQQANCLAIRAPNAAAAQTGDLLEVLPLP